MSEIRQAIQVMAKQGNVQSFSAYVGKVESVNDTTCDVMLIADGVMIFDVRLKAATAGNTGFYAKPKQGSFVVIVMLDKTNAFVAACDEVEEIYCIADGQDNGGVVKIEPLLQRLNKIEQTLTSALTLIQTHTHAVASGVASPSPMLAAMITNAGTTVRSNLENIKFRH